jgi:hypothetical protein
MIIPDVDATESSGTMSEYIGDMAIARTPTIVMKTCPHVGSKALARIKANGVMEYILVKKFEAVSKYKGKKEFAKMPNVSKKELTI